MTDRITDTPLLLALHDIARTASMHLDCTPAPNCWDEIRIEDFDPAGGDFEMTADLDRVIFAPLTKAGREWAAAHLPADCPRWGAGAYIFEARWAGLVRKGAIRDRLTEATPDNKHKEKT